MIVKNGKKLKYTPESKNPPPEIKAELEKIKGKKLFNLSSKEKDYLLYVLALHIGVIDADGRLI